MRGERGPKGHNMKEATRTYTIQAVTVMRHTHLWTMPRLRNTGAGILEPATPTLRIPRDGAARDPHTQGMGSAHQQDNVYTIERCERHGAGVSGAGLQGRRIGRTVAADEPRVLGHLVAVAIVDADDDGVVGLDRREGLAERAVDPLAAV